ncbi:MAG TPA: FkbM family methyltransferase [Pseudonocardiaceae bacterium]|jgi:FkbM family methyltransferase|nr:FkbM family methyltransferase [Pseudonocardiaceae bacterium]
MVRLDRPALTNAAVRLLARHTPYMEAEMLGLSEVVGPGAVCIDIGAAAGLYTLALSELVGPTGVVHSVEPLPFAHQVWKRLLRSESAGNVRPHTGALGLEPGKGVISVPIGPYGLVTGRSFLTGRSKGLGSNAEFAGHVDIVVDVETLDGMCDRLGLTRLDFLKIDVEGAELHVLESGQRAIETYRPAMLVEIEDRHISRYAHSAADIVDWLVKRDYTMHVWRDGWRPAEIVTAETRNYLFRPTL